MDQYIVLAKKAVKSYLKEGEILKPPSDLPKEMLTKKAGVFVSIYKNLARGENLVTRSSSQRSCSLRAARNKKTSQPVSQSANQLELRGCIGTFLPTCDCLASEIIKNAISASSNDPRFLPIQENELEDIHCSVDILSSPQRISNLEELDPKKYGLIVRCGAKTGLLLPDIAGVDKREHQIMIACQKAGIDPSKESIKIYRFTVERHKEENK